MTDLFPTAVYLLCFLTSSGCAYLLARSYRQTRARLLFWSALCFALLAGNNLVVMVDLIGFPQVDLTMARLVPLAAALTVLLFGLVWDLED